ncbi:MAG: hypothetical protein F4X59_17520 [Holophagales bacterium]|nr:hypothetical protein [Holophagales bacterium]MYC11906.1 hypothetical protein [Holophagales bacterium]
MNPYVETLDLRAFQRRFRLVRFYRTWWDSALGGFLLALWFWFLLVAASSQTTLAGAAAFLIEEVQR